MNLPIKLAKPRVIDAGANIGLATRFLKMKYPDAEILAIEPDSDNFELLQRNTEGLTGVSCVRAGLWWRAQKLCIANASDEAWAYRTEEAQAEASITIDAFTLDQLMEKNGWSFVELVKLDIESAELQVLKNSADWISKVGAILIETHDNLKPGCRLAAYMATRDFPYEMQLGEKILFSQWEWEGASARA
ncbi:MAG: FkbM family methyltransferase [Planctomycetes bacterium]|nr:FkbM family methyltransferase [Planctomycetota bacterium]